MRASPSSSDRRALRHRWLPVLAAALFALLTCALAGCATAKSMRSGQTAEQLQDYDRAIVEYTKVLREHPENRLARESLDRAKLRARTVGNPSVRACGDRAQPI